MPFQLYFPGRKKLKGEDIYHAWWYVNYREYWDRLNYTWKPKAWTWKWGSPLRSAYSELSLNLWIIWMSLFEFAFSITDFRQTTLSPIWAASCCVIYWYLCLNLAFKIRKSGCIFFSITFISGLLPRKETPLVVKQILT